MIGDYAPAAALAAILPGLLAWLGTRRWGLIGLLGTLGLCAVVAVVGWILTQDVRVGDAQLLQAAIIFFIFVPGIVSLILGSVFGFWEAHRDRIDDRLP